MTSTATRPDGATRRLTGHALVAVGSAAYAVTAYGYGVGSLTEPKTGLVPCVVGVVAVVISLTMVAGDLRGREAPSPLETALEDAVASGGGTGEPNSRYDVAVTLAITAAVCLFTIWQSRIIGLLPASGIATAVIAWTMRSRLLTAVLVGALFYLTSWLVFERWLAVPLPHGYL